MEKIKNFFKKHFKNPVSKDFREIKKEERYCQNKKKISVFNKLVFVTGTVAAYFVGKTVMKEQFKNALFDCEFITPSVKGKSIICKINSLKDIVNNSIQLHEIGQAETHFM